MRGSAWWKGADQRVNALLKKYVTPVDAKVIEIVGDKARVAFPGESDDPVENTRPAYPVVGALPAVGEQVLVLATFAGGWIITSGGSGSGAVDSVDGRTGAVTLGDLYVNETDHTKAAHDALGIDAATLDSVDSTGFVRHAGGITSFEAGPTETERPVAGVEGRFYLSTSNGRLYYDTGATWALRATVNYGDLFGKPSAFPPEAHSHPVADIEATGTADGTTYLRGDGAWATPAGVGGGTHGDTHTSTGTDPVPDAVADGASGLLSGADKTTLDVLGQVTRAERVTDTPIDSQSWTLMTWDSEAQDEIGCFDPAAPARMTPPAGKYLGTATSTWNSNTTGNRTLRIYHYDSAGTLKSDYSTSNVSAAIDQFGRNFVPMVAITIVAGDYLVVEVWHNAGTTLDFGIGTVTTLPTPYFQLMRVR